MTRLTMAFVRRIGAALVTVALVAVLGLPGMVQARPLQPPEARTVTLTVGQGIHFATGKVTQRAADADLAFLYLPPQSGAGQFLYNAMSNRAEYHPSVRTNRNLPLVRAAKTGAFKVPPDLNKLTVGDVSNWTADEYDVATGRYILVRGATRGKHYLLHITRYVAPSQKPASWRLTFTYRPITLPLGASGAAGTSMALSGTLTYQEWIYSKKIITLDLATGRVTERFDGFAPSRTARGEMAYLDSAGRIVIVGPDGAVRATLPSPATEAKSFTYSGPDDAVISPNGTRIAVQVNRRSMMGEGSFQIPGIPLPGIAVMDRTGKEVAFFPKRTGPTWTPDGRLVVSDFESPGIAISDREVRNLYRIPHFPQMQQISGIAVSPDGSHLAFSANGRAWTAKLDGSGLKQLTTTGRYEDSPTWSPDGRYIVLRAQDPSSVSGVYEVAVVRVADGKTFSVVDEQGRRRAPNSRILWR